MLSLKQTQSDLRWGGQLESFEESMLKLEAHVESQPGGTALTRVIAYDQRRPDPAASSIVTNPKFHESHWASDSDEDEEATDH